MVGDHPEPAEGTTRRNARINHDPHGSPALSHSAKPCEPSPPAPGMTDASLDPLYQSFIQPTLAAFREYARLASLIPLESVCDHQTKASSALGRARVLAGSPAPPAQTSVFHVKHTVLMHGKVVDLRSELPKYSLIRPCENDTLTGHVNSLGLSRKECVNGDRQGREAATLGQGS